MLSGVVGVVKGLFKPFEAFQKELGKEIPYFILGIGMEGGKGLGWKGSIFVWPFLIAFILVFVLFLKIFLTFVIRILF